MQVFFFKSRRTLTKPEAMPTAHHQYVAVTAVFKCQFALGTMRRARALNLDIDHARRRERPPFRRRHRVAYPHGGYSTTNTTSRFVASAATRQVMRSLISSNS